MVLGLSIGRKGAKKSKEAPISTIRTSPSLPELHSQGIPWPEDLVDLPSVRASRQEPGSPSKGAAKISFQSSFRAFHKPFRGNEPASPTSATGENGTIASMYISQSRPPSAFSRTGVGLVSNNRSQRRPRIAPTFNIMVAGSKGTGKSSLLQLFLSTLDVSPSATAEQKASVDRFIHNSGKRTRSLQTANIEICESRFDRVLLSVIDTPGLDFAEGQELNLERAVSGLVKYLDLQFADTMGEESKVVRQSKGDQHVHLCIYLIDPDTVVTAASRRAKSSLPTRTRSQTTFSYRPDDLSSLEDEETSDDSEDEGSSERLTLSPMEIRVIKRLSARVNVLPVIARADSLIDQRLAAVKKAVRRDLKEAGLGFGVFGPALDENEKEEPEQSDEEDDRPSRPVIKIKSTRRLNGRQVSRSRNPEDDDDEEEEEVDDAGSMASSSPRLSRSAIASLLPFALVAPEPQKPPRRKKTQPEPEQEPQTPASEVVDTRSAPPSAFPASMSRRPPKELEKGKFVRRYRWGTIDVLDPNHCDFVALRTAVLSTHLPALKSTTKEVLYEKYRTEKLLARRATRNISDEERKRLLNDIGL